MLIVPDAQGQIDTRQVEIVFVSDMFVEDYSGKAEIFKKYRFSTGWDLSENDFNDKSIPGVITPPS